MMVFWLMAVSMGPERSRHILEIFKRYYLKGMEIGCMPQEARLCGEGEWKRMQHVPDLGGGNGH